MFRSKHSGWTWEGKRTPFGGGGGMSVNPGMPSQGGKGPASPVGPSQAPAKDVVQERLSRLGNNIPRDVSGAVANAIQGASQAGLQQTAQPQPTPQTQQAPVQQPTPVSPFVQQQRQQMMQQQMPQMRGIGGPQQPGLQSMLARILGYGGGMGYMPQQMMRQGMPSGYGQGMPPQGYGQQMSGMPNYGRFGAGQNPLAYRPDMQPAINNTGNVAVSVAEQQRRALQAQLDAANAQLAAQQTTGLGYGGGSDGGGG